PPLAQHYLVIAFRQDIFRRHDEVPDGRAHAALEQHRTVGLTDFAQQIKILHIAGADLEHIGVTADQLDLARVHDLRDHGHGVFVARVAKNSEALFPQSLETIWTSAGLEGAATKDVGPRCFNHASDAVQDLSAFHRARSRDHRQETSADPHRTDAHNRVRR